MFNFKSFCKTSYHFNKTIKAMKKSKKLLIIVLGIVMISPLFQRCKKDDKTNPPDNFTSSFTFLKVGNEFTYEIKDTANTYTDGLTIKITAQTSNNFTFLRSFSNGAPFANDTMTLYVDASDDVWKVHKDGTKELFIRANPVLNEITYYFDGTDTNFREVESITITDTVPQFPNPIVYPVTRIREYKTTPLPDPDETRWHINKTYGFIYWRVEFENGIKRPF